MGFILELAYYHKTSRIEKYVIGQISNFQENLGKKN